MIFSHGLDDKVRDGTKTQTRRLKTRFNNDYFQTENGEIVAVATWNKSKSPRQLWRVGNTYAIQSGRGVKGNGRFRILKIRGERLQDISAADCKAEGIRLKEGDLLKRAEEDISRWGFMRLWNSIHKKSGDRWKDNPEVWVLEIEPANGR